MIMLIIVLIVLVFVCVYYVIGRRITNNKKEAEIINQTYNSAEGNFVISGEKDRFIITKNELISFLVEDGQIVACMDKRVDKEFKYYEVK